MDLSVHNLKAQTGLIHLGYTELAGGRRTLNSPWLQRGTLDNFIIISLRVVESHHTSPDFNLAGHIRLCIKLVSDLLY